MNKVFYLYGVEVSEEEFYLEPEKVDIQKYIINEKNIQRKMAFLNKVGMELFYKRVGKANILDEEKNKKGEIIYQLLEFDNKEFFTESAFYLYMRNPSIGVYHLEGINKNDLPKVFDEIKHVGIKKINSIDCALHWRKGDNMRKIKVDNINGEDWKQQGDVCIYNKNAKSLKLRPCKLT